MQERKRSDTATKRSPGKDKIEDTKGIKKCLKLLLFWHCASPFHCRRTTNQEISKGKLFISWKLGYLQADAKPIHPLLSSSLGDVARSWDEDCAQRAATGSSTRAATHLGNTVLGPPSNTQTCVWPCDHHRNQGTWHVVPSTLLLSIPLDISPLLLPHNPAYSQKIHWHYQVKFSLPLHLMFSSQEETRTSLTIIFWVTQLILKCRTVNIVYFLHLIYNAIFKKKKSFFLWQFSASNQL